MDPAKSDLLHLAALYDVWKGETGEKVEKKDLIFSISSVGGGFDRLCVMPTIFSFVEEGSLM
eukprot:1392735-Amorphochlora_amoeboformis.AAC.2